MIHRLTKIVNQRRGKYILILILNQILHFLNWKFATLEAKNTSYLPLWQSISKTFKWISLTKIQYYPCRAIRGSEKSIKKKIAFCRVHNFHHSSVLQHRERGNNPLRVPSIFRCRNKVFGVYVKNYSAVYTRKDRRIEWSSQSLFIDYSFCSKQYS